MNIYELTPDAIPAVAHLMCTIKPDWWDYDGAYEQLSNIDETIKTVGWYLENGFCVIGIQPNAYARGFHLIMLGKEI